MPSANVAQLRTELDSFARTRLTESDFDPVLEVEAELDLNEITPALFQMLSLLEPYGTGNHEPTFTARNVRLVAPPKILKDKHIKLKLKAGERESAQRESAQAELSAIAIMTTPSCHPDSAAIRRSEKAEAVANQLRTDNREPRTAGKLRAVFDSLGWNMA
jgi:single-stranded DNA-specific DHH superfamily exonuclease